MTLRLHYSLFAYVQRFAKGIHLPTGEIARKRSYKVTAGLSWHPVIWEPSPVIDSCFLSYCRLAIERKRKNREEKLLGSLLRFLQLLLTSEPRFIHVKSELVLCWNCSTNHLSVSISISVSSGTPELCIAWLKSKKFSSRFLMLWVFFLLSYWRLTWGLMYARQAFHHQDISPVLGSLTPFFPLIIH